MVPEVGEFTETLTTNTALVRPLAIVNEHV